MAQIKDILDTEYVREGMNNFLTIHLYKEGTFYRAYEWSAWLCVNYVKHDMKVTHKKTKTSLDFTFVGFPVTSLEKYVPENAVA